MRTEKKVHLVVASDNPQRREVLAKIARDVYCEPTVIEEATGILETGSDDLARLVLLETNDDLAKLCHVAWVMYHQQKYTQTPLLLTFASDTAFLQEIYNIEGIDKDLLIVQFREAFPHLAHFNWDNLAGQEVSCVVGNVLDSLRNPERFGEGYLLGQPPSPANSLSGLSHEPPSIVIAADSRRHREMLTAIVSQLPVHRLLVLEGRGEVVNIPLGRDTVVFLEAYSHVPVLVQTIHAWWRRYQNQTVVPRFVAVVTETSRRKNPFLKQMRIENQQVFCEVVTYEQIDRNTIRSILLT